MIPALDRFGAIVLLDEASHLEEVLGEVVVGSGALRSKRGEAPQLRDYAIELAVAIKRIAPPRPRKVSMLDKTGQRIP
jgi:hypothetical protein